MNCSRTLIISKNSKSFFIVIYKIFDLFMIDFLACSTTNVICRIFIKAAATKKLLRFIPTTDT